MRATDGSPPRHLVLLAAGLTTVVAVLVAALRTDSMPTSMRRADSVSRLPVPPGAGARGPLTNDADLNGGVVPVRTAAVRDTPDWLCHPFEVVLKVHVCDAAGQPVAGHVPVLVPTGGTPVSAGLASDGDGVVVVRWPTRQPEVQIGLVDPRGHLHPVRLRHGQPTPLVLVLPAEQDHRASAERLPVLGEPRTLHPYVRFADDSHSVLGHGTGAAPVAALVPHRTTDDGRRHDLTLVGSVHDPNSVPLVDVEVEWRCDDGASGGAARTDADGSFELRGLPSGRGLVVVHGLEGMAMPLASRAGVAAGDRGVRLIAHRAGGSVLRLHAPSNGRRASWLMVQDESTSFLAIVAADPDRSVGAWQIAHLHEGWYSVVLQGPGLEVVSLGRHWLDGRQTLDLGTAASTRSCDVQIESVGVDLPAPPRLELFALRADFDRRLATRPRPGERLLLPAGDYALFGAMPGRRTAGAHPVRFTARPGDVTVVPLPR